MWGRWKNWLIVCEGVLELMACCEWDGDAVTQEATNLSIHPVLTIGEQHACKAMREFHCL